jgi:hypothetical protein
MKIKFERIYGENRIGDVVEFEKGEELNYILTTNTASIIEDDNFENNEILETEKETSENNSEVAKNGKTKKK